MNFVAGWMLAVNILVLNIGGEKIEFLYVLEYGLCDATTRTMSIREM